MSLEQRRADFERRLGARAAPPDVTVRTTRLPHPPGLWLCPRDTDGRDTLLHLHGGGYVMGSAHGARGLAGRIAKETGACALALDYRLAPEHPYPAAVEDGLAAYEHLIAGTGGRPLAIIGHSAGGGLALAVFLRARAGSLPLPAAAVLMSPWLDLTARGGSRVTRSARDPVLTLEDLEEMAAWYARNADPAAPELSPVNADLAGLPPLLVQVGAEEILYDDATRLVRRARDSGVSATLDVYPGMPHVFQQDPTHAQTTEAIQRIGTFLRDARESVTADDLGLEVSRVIGDCRPSGTVRSTWRSPISCG